MIGRILCALIGHNWRDVAEYIIFTPHKGRSARAGAQCQRCLVIRWDPA